MVGLWEENWEHKVILLKQPSCLPGPNIEGQGLEAQNRGANCLVLRLWSAACMHKILRH